MLEQQQEYIKYFRCIIYRQLNEIYNEHKTYVIVLKTIKKRR